MQWVCLRGMKARVFSNHSTRSTPRPGAPLRPGEGVAGQAFVQRRPVLVADYPRLPERLAWAVERGTCVAAAVPLIVGTRAIGVLAVRRHRPEPYTLEQAEVLTLLAAFVAPALEAARLHAESDHQRRLATEQSERLATILEQLPSAVLVLDAGGRIVLSNSAARRATGDTYDPDRPLAEQVDRYRPRDPSSRRVLQATETPSARVLRGEVVDRAELLVWHAEQQSDAWLHVDGVPLQDAAGHLNGAVLVYTDVTRERTLARDLAARGARTRAVAGPAGRAQGPTGAPRPRNLPNRRWFRPDPHPAGDGRGAVGPRSGDSALDGARPNQPADRRGAALEPRNGAQPGWRHTRQVGRGRRRTHPPCSRWRMACWRPSDTWHGPQGQVVLGGFQLALAQRLCADPERSER